MSSWTQPQCERCYVASKLMVENGQPIIAMPVVIVDPELEQCAWCGALTVVGIFRRADPATVLFARQEPEDEPVYMSGQVMEKGTEDGTR